MQPRHRLLILLVSLTLIGCKPLPPPPKPIDTANLNDLKDLKYFNAEKYDQSKIVSPLREESLKDSAMSIGAQGALSFRSEQIDNILIRDTNYLDQAFNFAPFILPNNVLPPVLVQGRQQLNLADDTTVRIADQTYHIEQQAKFVTTAPSWHDYLWMDFPKPAQPENGLLPKNPRESQIWDKYILEGWKQGLDQANNIFAENVSRLKRDYVGIALYRKLLDENMISSPFVATTSLGVTGDKNDISINDQVKRITALPELDPNASHWKPAIAQSEG
jgi:defect in organelle trafficking protein DotC